MLCDEVLLDKVECALTHTMDACDKCGKCPGIDGVDIRLGLIRELERYRREHKSYDWGR